MAIDLEVAKNQPRRCQLMDVNGRKKTLPSWVPFSFTGLKKKQSLLEANRAVLEDVHASRLFLCF